MLHSISTAAGNTNSRAGIFPTTRLRTCFWDSLQTHYGSREIRPEISEPGPPAFTSNTIGVRTSDCPLTLGCDTTTRHLFVRPTSWFRTSIQRRGSWGLRHDPL